mgnify:CR=1 FL=1
MLNFTSRTTYYLSSTPTDMRNGREGLAGIIREKMQHDPYSYDEAFIFYPRITARLKYYIMISMVLSYTRSGLMMVSFSSLVSWRLLAVIR